LVDDFDGGPADETIRFSMDGTDYEIDLSKENAENLRAAVAPFAGAARVVGGRTRRGARERGTPQPTLGPDARSVRAWAQENGYQMSPRGRISREIVEAYLAAGHS
jgi:hypothetical protein